MYYVSPFSRLKHGFFTRNGGVSPAPYDSLNFSLKAGDTPANILKNAQIVLEALDCRDKKLVTLNQVHSNTVLVVEEPWSFNPGLLPAADAMITRNTDLVLGIFTADCLPILLHDPVRATIGVIHAGWRGLAASIIEKTIQKMIALGSQADHIAAALGPCIHQENYEVGPEVREAFGSTGNFVNLFFKHSHTKDKYLFDLPGMAMEKLKACHLSHIDWLPRDTYTQEKNFFSCRRSFHNQVDRFGCQISVIAL